ASTGPGEYTEKLHTAISMYDGSYFYRLMDVGGALGRMFEVTANAHSFSGLVFAAAIITLLVTTIGNAGSNKTRATWFLLLAAALITVGVFLLPGAVRIHHAVLVFPLPQLVIAAAAALLWDVKLRSNWTGPVVRLVGLIAVAALLASQLFV